MSEVFAAINHRLSEEYTKIELPTLDAKERYVHSQTFNLTQCGGAHDYVNTDCSPTHAIYTRSSRC